MILAVMLGVALGGVTARATDALYANYGLVTEPPQIDATAFLNAGVMEFSDTYYSVGSGVAVPFDTSYTLSYTNRGLMNSSMGWRFEYVTEDNRYPAAVFDNQQTILAQNQGSISYTDESVSEVTSASFLSVNATNVYSQGLIGASSQGLVKLMGRYIDVSQGGIAASDASLESSGYAYTDYFSSGVESETNYLNPANIQDLYWGIGVNQVLGGDGYPLYLTSGRFQPPFVYSPSYQVIDTYGYTNYESVPTYYYYTRLTDTNVVGTNVYGTNYLGSTYYYYSPPMLSFIYTNRVADDSWVQAVYVTSNLFDTNVNINVRFYPQYGATNGSSDVVVEFSTVEEDVVSGLQWTNYLYLTDLSLSQTNSSLKRNYTSYAYKPSAFTISRAQPYEWYVGVTSNTVYSAGLFYNASMSTPVVTNYYSAYAVQIGQNMVLTNSMNSYRYSSILNYNYNPALEDPTNYSGRVELVGLDQDLEPMSEELNLENARIRCEGLLTIKTKNLVSTEGTRIDAPLMSVDLGSATSTLVISNLFPGSIKRLKGQIAAWSSVWTNEVTSLSVSNDATSGAATVTTNTIPVRYHVLILDHALTAEQAVVANRVALHATNVVIHDDLNINGDLKVDGENLLVEGKLTMPNGLGATNFPNLKTVTNNGYITVPSQANLGGDRAEAFDSVVNHGILYGGGHQLRAHQVLIQSTNTDSIASNMLSTNFYATNYALVSAYNGATRIMADDLLIDNGIISSMTDIEINGGNILARNSLLSAGSISTTTAGGEIVLAGAITLRPTNSISDGGTGTLNVWQTLGGISMLSKPAHGDLLATRVETFAPRYAVLRNVWAGEDRGATVEGFKDNGALGWLVLDGRDGCKFRFTGASSKSAMYVDYLDFRNVATNFASVMQIDPNIMVYFANANVPVEKLDGRFNGRLRWVPQYTGEFSGTNWTAPSGFKHRVNAALLRSMEYDSDNDGVVNGLDSTPFILDETVKLEMVVKDSETENRTLSFTWSALAFGKSTLEYTRDLSLNDWTTFTNIIQGPVPGPVSVDVPAPADKVTVYRVRVTAE